MALTANSRPEPFGDLCVSEIGHLATQVDKRRWLKAARIPELPRVAYAAHDFAHFAWP
jgi:hypothetical protein